MPICLTAISEQHGIHELLWRLFIDMIRLRSCKIYDRLSFDEHVSNVCRSSYYHMKALRHIRHSSLNENSTTIAESIVISKLDYCNSILYGTSKKNLREMQNIRIHWSGLYINCLLNRQQNLCWIDFTGYLLKNESSTKLVFWRSSVEIFCSGIFIWSDFFLFSSP